MGIEIARLDCLFPVRYGSKGTADFEQGMTIEDVAPIVVQSGNWGAIVNGKNIHSNDWPHFKISDGSQIIFTPLPENLLAFSPVAFQQLVTSIFGSIALNMAISKLLGVPEVDQFEGTESNTYSFQNLQQTAGAGLPIKIVYGIHPVAGNILEMDLTGQNPSSANLYGSTLDLTIGLCEGEISSVDSVSLNGNDLSTYSSLATQSQNLGTNTQTALGSPGTSTTQNVSGEIQPNITTTISGGQGEGAAGPAFSYTTTQAVDSASLNLLFVRGLYVSGESGIGVHNYSWKYRYRDTAASPSTFNLFTDVVVSSNQIGAWIHSETVTFPSKSIYEIEVVQVNPTEDSLDFNSLSHAHDANLDSVVERTNNVYSYPNLSTLRLVINSDESINGSAIPNVIATVTGRKITKWDGVSLTTPNFVDAAPYSNPSWIVYDLLTTARYGLGNWVDSDNVDLQSFKDWADWCDDQVSDGADGSESRATWNGVIDGASSAWESALAVCASARATLYTIGETVKVKFERARTPTQMFNMANIVEGSWSQSYLSRLDRPTRVDVQFLNADANYQVDVVGEDDPDAIAAGLPQRTLQIELPGVTRESQARREARFRLNVEKLGSVVAWESDIDAVACEPGDLILVQHDLPQWGEGGRATAGSSTSITIDRNITLVDGNSYKVLVRHSDDTREERTITNIAGTYTSGTALTVDSAWTANPVAGDLYSLGPFEIYSKKVVLSSITTTGELTRRLEGVIYDETIHEDEITTAAATFLDLPDPQRIPGVVTNLTVTELKTSDTQAAVSWNYPTDSSVASAKIWSRDTSTDPYVQIGTAQWPAAQTVLPFRPGHSQQVAVTAVSPTGAHLPPTSTTPVTFEAGGMGAIPLAPTSLALKQDDDLLEISWTAPTTPVDRYEIRRGLSWVGSQFVGTTTRPSLISSEWCPSLSTGLTETYHVRAVRDGRFGSVASVDETNSLTIWTGGTASTNDFSASNWSGNTLSNMTILAEGAKRVVKNTTPGTIAKLESSVVDTGSLGSHRIGLLIQAEFEDDTWTSATYAWQSETGTAKAWGGYIDPSKWKTAVAIQFRTRTSSSSSWTAWRPLTSRVPATAFQEIQVLAEFKPTDSSQTITVREMTLIVET